MCEKSRTPEKKKTPFSVLIVLGNYNNCIAINLLIFLIFFFYFLVAHYFNNKTTVVRAASFPKSTVFIFSKCCHATITAVIIEARCICDSAETQDWESSAGGAWVDVCWDFFENDGPLRIRRNDETIIRVKKLQTDPNIRRD